MNEHPPTPHPEETGQVFPLSEDDTQGSSGEDEDEKQVHKKETGEVLFLDDSGKVIPESKQ